MNKLKSFLFKNLERTLFLFNRIGINKETPGAFKIYNFLYKLFWPYKNIIEIQGSKMYININDESLNMRKTFEGYASNLIHEKSTTELFEENVKEGNIVVDLGANIGYFTLLAAKLVGQKGKVYAFEPEPKNFRYLQKNIEINNYNQVITFQKAASNKDGKTKLYICDYDTGHHTINQYDGIKAYSRGRRTKEHFIEIETASLDSFFRGKENSIDVIKMDVEGAEVLALAGMDRILRINKKLKMFIEFFPLLIKKMGSSPENLIQKILDDYNFSIFIIPGDYSAVGDRIKRITSVKEIMNFCKGEEDHINLFITNQRFNISNKFVIKK